MQRPITSTLWFVHSLAGLLACTLGPKTNADDTASLMTTSEVSSGTGLTATGNLAPTSEASTTSVSTSNAVTEAPATSSSTSDGETFILAPDTGIGKPACDLTAQRCPEGQKCNPSALGCSFDFCGVPICVPLVPDAKPPGAACSMLGDLFDGTDDCELGSVCLDPDERGNGVCAQICEVGNTVLPTCTPGEGCFHLGCQEFFWGWCETSCDPREPDACEPGEVCFLNISLFCYADASGEEGQAGDPCEAANSCDPGVACIDATQVPSCEGESLGCCTPFCSTDEPNTCPGKDQGEVCVPVFTAGDEPSPKLANLGYCALPP